MPRHYERKRQSSWNSNSIQLAIKEYQSSKKPSCNDIAKKYGIPETTLRRYLKKDKDEYPVHGGRFRETFSEGELKQLMNYISDIDKRSFGLTKTQCQKLVYNFAEHNNIPHRFNSVTKMAGKDWLANFMNKFKFSLRTPEATSIGRLMAFNKSNVDLFFKLLKEIRLQYKFDASQIFNIDESGVSTVPTKLPKVISPTGTRRVAKIVSGERGKNITVVCGISAVGVYVPPFMIFPRKRMKSELMYGTPPGSYGTYNESGWMTADTFINYLQHFFKHVKPSAENPILLILDNHASHISYEAINYCRENHIIMLGFPPHTTHRLQPLDVAVFGPLKTFYSQTCDNFLVSHPGQAILEKDIGKLFGQAYNRAATIGNAVHGFSATGIEPYNPFIFSDLDFESAVVIDQPLLEAENNIHSTEAPLDIIEYKVGITNQPLLEAENNIHSIEAPLEIIEYNFRENLMEDAVIPERQLEILDSVDTPIEMKNVEVDIPHETETQDDTHLENNVPIYKNINVITTGLPPLPVAEKRNSKRAPRAKLPTFLLTSSPVKNMMKVKKEQKELKENKKIKLAEKRKANLLTTKNKVTKTKRVKRKLFTKNENCYSSEDSSAEEPVYNETDNEDSADEECLFCTEKYKNDDKGEAWIKCIKCLRWAHDLCAGTEDWKTFACDFCNNRD